MIDTKDPRSVSHIERVALVLQGGGALGAYQAGVYEGLAADGLQPDWVAGISIGAINAAIIAGSRPEQRVEKLRAFWEQISAPTSSGPDMFSDFFRPAMDSVGVPSSLVFGQPGFFRPRVPPAQFYGRGSERTMSYYDTSALLDTLTELVDFERLNSGEVRLSVGAVNIKTGNFEYFDTKDQEIGPEHIMASGALPPGLPAIEINGEYFWDGGLISNTPLEYVLGYEPRHSTLVFQIDVFSTRGRVPKNMLEVLDRSKEISFSSRTRKNTDMIHKLHDIRHLLKEHLETLPQRYHNDPVVRKLRDFSCSTTVNIVQLIYRSKYSEGHTKDYEFSPRLMKEHWQAGLNDCEVTLHHPRWLEAPPPDVGVVVHDILRDMKGTDEV